MDDLGLKVVDAIFSGMMIDKQWSVRHQRGFKWWGKDFAQNVCADPPFADNGFRVTRLHARTDMLRNVKPSAMNIACLNAMNVQASMSGLCFDVEDSEKVQLVASVYAHEENLEWISALFLLVVAVQAADAEIKAHGLAELMKVLPATSAHPTSGPRQERDDMMNVLSGCVVPRGQGESDWMGNDFTVCVSMLQEPPCVMASASEKGLTAEFPFKGLTSLLRVTTDEDHPRLGHGVSFRLTLPTTFSCHEEAQRFALELNRKELVSLNRALFLGSWCDGSSGTPALTYVSFFPNAAHRPGLLPNLVMSMMLRAKWVAEEVFGDNWSKTYRETQAAVGRIVELIRKLGK